MNLYEGIRVALMSLVHNKMRSFLTMLGVIIGVAAVIIVVAIGQGLKKDTMSRIERMGTNLLMVNPGPSRRGGVVQEMTVINLKEEDAVEIAKTVPGVAGVAPEVRGRVQAKYRSRNTSIQLVGTSVDYAKVRNWKITEGRFFDDSEVRGRKRVCVLGSQVVTDLFYGKPAIGEFVRINGMPFEIIGTAAEVGAMWGSPDSTIVAPLTTVMYRVLGQDNLSSITVSARSAEDVDKVEKGIEVLLRKRHRLRPGQDNDFNIMKQSMFLESMAEAGETMTRLLGAIALVSLLVGGVGIMNIMLVSVTERTREVGVRKAVGARKLDILAQFLVESVVLSTIGGVLGILVGIGFSQLIARQSGWTAIISVSSIIYSFLFAGAVGIFFGLWPAKKAADMDPIAALRYE
ncbi:MAG: FtsX-like permease family protein [Armatimonadetes bacterium]|nr:FtsX-like permease family protein [Armatimonadota bacterium]